MVHERRKRKFINSWAQVSIAIEVVLHSLLLLALIALLLFAPPFVTIMSHYPVSDHQAVAKDLWAMNISKWPLFLGLAVFIGIVSVLFSHHIVGPAYKFQTVLHELAERNLSVSFKLRKWDYMIEVQDELNRHIARLREDLVAVQEHAQLLRRKVSNIDGKVGKEASAELESELDGIVSILKRYQGLTHTD